MSKQMLVKQIHAFDQGGGILGISRGGGHADADSPEMVNCLVVVGIRQGLNADLSAKILHFIADRLSEITSDDEREWTESVNRYAQELINSGVATLTTAPDVSIN